MPNNRIFYAVRQVGFAPLGAGSFTAAHGVQSFGMTTTFPLEQIFELGQVSIYDNIEGIPDIEVNLEKVLDGYSPLYLLATKDAAATTLVGRSNVRTMIGVSYFSDTSNSATGAITNTVVMSGMFVKSIGYQFQVDGAFKETLGLVGNHKVWFNGGTPENLPTFSGQFTTNADTPQAIGPSGGVNRRQNLYFGATDADLDVNGACEDANCTILPFGVGGIPGISASGTNDKVGSAHNAHIQRINVSTDLNREAINELGQKIPYHRFANFPVQVTTEIEIVGVSGDLISATEAGVGTYGRNTTDQTIRVATKEGLRLNLGTKNRLQSVNCNGGDTGGGNETYTYSYINFNDMDVKHIYDVTTGLRPSNGGPPAEAL